MDLIVKINMDNAAFEDTGELSRILNKLAAQVNGRTFEGEHASTLRDSNGNTVGTWEIS